MAQKFQRLETHMNKLERKKEINILLIDIIAWPKSSLSSVTTKLRGSSTLQVLTGDAVHQ